MFTLEINKISKNVVGHFMNLICITTPTITTTTTTNNNNKNNNYNAKTGNIRPIIIINIIIIKISGNFNWLLLCNDFVFLNNDNKDKYPDLARELKKLWNMKVTVIPIETGALGSVTKRLVQELEGLEMRGRVETIQTAGLLKSARILRRVLETWGDLLWLRTSWKTIS